MLLIEIIAAIFLPPLAVFLRTGLGIAFLVSLLLTPFGWIPGVLFALVVVLKPDLLPADWMRPRLR